MNSNFLKFIRDLDKMNPDKTDSINYKTLKDLSDRLMLDELLCGEADPVEFLKETLLDMKKDLIRNHHLRRLKALEENEQCQQ